MQKQKRVTDFFSSPVAKKSPSASPRTPLFELDTQLAVAKKPRVSLCETDVRQTILDAGQRKIGGQYCKQCDMMYCIDSITEVAMHDKHHNKYSDGSTHFIAGIIIAEPLKSAQYSDSGKELHDGEPIVGVNRIWTHPTARRKGVASELLDVIRHRYFTGTLVPKSRVAFSDPSDDGKKFAERYVRSCSEASSSFLVYTVTK
ncbi:hypothetical protein ANCDUO_04348 [Ancylostoma duodenale]|uniref:N-acetyltransferase ESCO zinc-finger domain-containing protein n=1 Tax=Ancylostoma duodenale TaxID=51022 RepID=A0A0C2DRH0_9BILA|nr:hypothetical protein ANCDUO_04348 [Ancylostoma duodenale]